ncbi:MAG TPA: hypothetical protein PLS51_00550 [Flavobacterium sp.]|nr:hypothetical protein [Flavobacterium sp.]HPJ09086.1 hypothetical protein [Flavobacterium sp.]
MIRTLLCFLLTSVLLPATAQTLTLKGKTYPATDSWDFICEQYALSGSAQVQIAKTEKGGLLQLSVETANTANVISGTVYVFLADHSTITCSDKGIREIKDGQIMGYYMFTAAEINKLKTVEIASIHFNIKGNGQRFNSQLGNFTAVNRKTYFATAFDKSKKSHDTAVAISKLYQ